MAIKNRTLVIEQLNPTLRTQRRAMILLSTGSLHNYGINRVFALAADAGFDGIEVLINGQWDSRNPAYLRRLSSDYGMPVAALHSPFVTDMQGWPTDQLGRLEHTVSLAQELGVPVVVSHLPLRFFGVVCQLHLRRFRRLLLPMPWPKRRDPYYYFVRDGRLQELESSSGVVVALENMPVHRFLGFPINAYWFNRTKELTRFSHLTLDTTHWGTWGVNPVEVYEQLKRRVAHIHISNFDGRDHRSPPDGVLPLAALLRRLAKDKYPGAVSVESAPDALDAGDDVKCRAALKRALAFCREHYSPV